MCRVGGTPHAVTSVENDVGRAVMYRRVREHRDAGVAVNVVVPCEELAVETLAILKRTEAVGKARCT